MNLNSSFYQDLVPYRIQKFNGLDQNMSDLEQIASGKTANCEGLSQRGGKLSTNEFGYGCLPFDWAKEGKRVYGIIPALDKGYFYSTVAEDDGGGSLSSKTFYMNMFTFATTQLDTHNPKFLVSSSILNSRVATADGNSMRKYYQATIFDDLVRQPQQVTFNADSGTGITGSFYYRVTLIDAVGNETGGGIVSAVRTVVDKTINPTVTITGFDTAAKGYTKIRWYRTVTTTTPPTDLEDQTFYYLGAASDSTIVSGTTTYTIAEAVADATLILNDQLNNSIPVDGTFYADIVFQWDNRLFALATTEGSTYFKSRVRWCLLTDSTATSLGNITSWRQQDYIDLDPDDGDSCIGGWGGFSGVGFVFKGDATYRLTPTGSTTAPYRADKINDEYGFYHHTIDDTGNGLIGRTRSAICVFNGSSFSIISDEVDDTIQNSQVPFGDSGVFDSKTKKYYFSMCDGRLFASYYFLSGDLQGLAKSYRNTTIIFDASERKWEVHSSVPCQVYKKLEDSTNKAQVFLGGRTNDIFIKLNQFQNGVSFSKKSLVTSINTLLMASVSTSTNQFQNRKVSIPMYFDSSGSKIIFTNTSSVISSSVLSGSDTIITLSDQVPIIITAAADYYLAIIDSSLGTTATPAAGKLEDSGTNYFSSDTITDYSVFYDVDGSGEVYSGVADTDGIVVVDSNTLTVTTSPTSGKKYILFPHSWNLTIANASLIVPYHRFKSPLLGQNQSTRRKSFRFLQLMVRGMGVLRIRTYIGGTTTVTQTIYQTLADRNVWVNNAIDLNGAVGDSISVEIGMARGAGDFECQELTVWTRLQGGLRDA